MAKTTKKSSTTHKTAAKKKTTAKRSAAGKKKVTKLTKTKAKAAARKVKGDGIVRPTRNRTAYMMFVKDVRNKTQADNLGMSFVDVTREVANKWQALSKRERKPYEALAKTDKERYEREVAAFREQYPDEPLTVKKKKRTPKLKGPKKARSAYVFYTIHERPNVQGAHPDLDFGEITKRVAASWKKLNAKQKRKYDNMAEEDKGRYEEEASTFNEEHPEVAKRRKRAKKNAPKKGRSAYLYFTMERRPQLKEENPDMVFGDLTRLVAEEWGDLSDAGKRKFVKLADEDMKRYKDEMADYTPPTDEELDAELEGSKKKKRSGPKRPRTAYVYFTIDQRPNVQADNPELKFGEITKLLAEDWKALSESDREKYVEQAEADKLRYERERDAQTA
jgi:hypothetical protein